MVVAYTKEISVRPDSLFVIVAKEKVPWGKCCKTKTVTEIQEDEDDKEFFFGEIYIDKLDSDNDSP